MPSTDKVRTRDRKEEESKKPKPEEATTASDDESQSGTEDESDDESGSEDESEEEPEKPKPTQGKSAQNGSARKPTKSSKGGKNPLEVTNNAADTVGGAADKVGDTLGSVAGGGGGGGGGDKPLKLRLDLNIEAEVTLKAKIHGDITLSLLVRPSNMPHDLLPEKQGGVLRIPKFSTQDSCASNLCASLRLVCGHVVLGEIMRIEL